MSKELNDSFSGRLILYHLAIYLSFGLFALFVHLSHFTNDDVFAIYFVAFSVISLIIDLIYINKYLICKDVMVNIKSVIQLIALTVGCFVCDVNHLGFFGIIIMYMFIFSEMLSLDNTYDNTFLNIKRFLGGIIILVGVTYTVDHHVDPKRILIGLLISAAVVGVSIHTSDLLHATIYMLNKKYIELESYNENIRAENDRLKVYQDKVNHVNNEINLQKINLGKVNNELKALNSDIRALVNIMKEVSSTRDVEECVDILLKNIMNDRKPDICGFYIKPGVFLENEEIQKILVAREGNNLAPASNIASEKIFTIMIKDMFYMVEKNDYKNVVPISIDGEKAKLIPDLDIDFENLIVVPAFMDNKLYGILLVGDRTAEFFEGGFSFYESAVVNLSSSFENIELYLKMQDMARKDGLSGIYNRAYFNEIFYDISKDAMENNNNLSVAMLDIDKFKSVNDTYGHLAGDAVIKNVAGIMQKYAKEYHGIACRYGGEEFVIILPEKSLEEAYEIVLTMHEEIFNSKVEFEKHIIKVNSSVGISSYPETTSLVHELLSRSDEAMYYGKEHGRGVVIIDGKEEETLQKR